MLTFLSPLGIEKSVFKYGVYCSNYESKRMCHGQLRADVKFIRQQEESYYIFRVFMPNE
jgi:hypothetical protein